MDLFTIKMALSLACSGLPTPSVDAYATVIYNQSVKLEQDPLITVAIIKHESKCVSSIISDDGFDFGLMQIRAMYYGGPSVNLLNPWVNITVGSYWIQSSQDFCHKQLGREPAATEYLSCYTGACKTKGKWCQPTKMSRDIAEYAACLQDNLSVKMSVHNCDAIYLRGMKI